VAAGRAAVAGAGIPQSDPCGFTGDPDASPEPLAFLNASILGGDGSCGAGPPPPPGDAAPAIAWVAPADGATVSGAVGLVVSATDAEDDDTSLVVEFRAGAGPWQPMGSSAAGHWTATWDSTTTPDGPTALAARVSDTGGHAITDTIDVLVDNVADPPPPQQMTIGKVSAWLDGSRNDRLRANVTVLANSSPLPGATVVGHFVVNGAARSASGTTAASGVANLDGGRVRRFDFVTFFCVDAVTHPSLVLTGSLPCVLVMP
jgi:hypothetical protein